MKPQKIILITPGEPSGIGPDICLDTAAQNWNAKLLIIADPSLIQKRAQRLKKPITISEIKSIDDLPENQQLGVLYVLPILMASDVECGHLNSDNSQYVIDCLTIAEEFCRTKKADALVTGPVHKSVINEAGINFSGHTEFLAEPSNSKPVMMLATKTLRVALATTHIPLRDVSDAISYETIVSTINTLNSFLINSFKIKSPRICVCGLNPHAGENGYLGSEEIDIIIPAVKTCANNGIDVSPPMPADTAFTQNNLKYYDAVITMYHDQGLPVLKHQGFGEAVNITLGLPFIRTSVDHGTALELAGTGKAESTSLFTAIDMAIELSGL